MSSPFREWYRHPVIIRKLTNTDPYSDRVTFDVPVTRYAHLEETVTITRNAQGAQVASTLTVFLPVTDAALVNAGARIQLPTSQHPDTVAISVQVVNEGNDLDGVTVMCE